MYRRGPCGCGTEWVTLVGCKTQGLGPGILGLGISLVLQMVFGSERDAAHLPGTVTKVKFKYG